MAARRELNWHSLLKKAAKLPVGESFGYYFSEEGTVEITTPTLGPKLEDLAKLKLVAAVAGGNSKARAILAVARAGFINILLTDQGAGEAMRKILEEGG